MAGTSLLALIDDIASLLDDVATMTKVAAKKTSSVLSDDLALNAEQVSGVRADRELPIVWAVAKGSAVNKLILVPAALAISAVAPWLIAPLLMIGGAYLCFEGFEKIAEKYLHRDEAETEHAEALKAIADPAVDLVAYEQEKIKGAIRTDFVLSAEIVVIALGTVKAMGFYIQVGVLVLIAVLITIGVYGLVAAIVKLDDAGLYLLKSNDDAALLNIRRALGRGLLSFAPLLMKSLSVIGTLAMFLVGGGILVHGIPGSHEFIHYGQERLHSLPVLGGLLSAMAATLINGVGGIIAGALLVALISLGRLLKATLGARQ